MKAVVIAFVLLASVASLAQNGETRVSKDGVPVDAEYEAPPAHWEAIKSKPRHWERMMMEKSGDEPCPAAPVAREMAPETRVVTDKKEQEKIIREIGAAVITEVQAAPESFYVVKVGMDEYGFVINLGGFWRKYLERDHINMETVSGSGFRMVWRGWFPQMWLGTGQWDTVGIEEGLRLRLKDGKAEWPVKEELL